MRFPLIPFFVVTGIALATSSVAVAAEYKVQPSQVQASVKVPKIIDRQYARDYILNGKGRWDDSIQAIVERDPMFEAGFRLLNDQGSYVSKTVPASLDPEVKSAETRVVRVADYKNAIINFADSAKAYQNPVSAYIAATLSIRLYGKGTTNPVNSDMPILTKILYQNEVCDGYVLYGEGLERNGNRAMAYDVYKKGIEQEKCSGWYQSVLGGKVSMMKAVPGN